MYKPKLVRKPNLALSAADTTPRKRTESHSCRRYIKKQLETDYDPKVDFLTPFLTAADNQGSAVRRNYRKTALDITPPADDTPTFKRQTVIIGVWYLPWFAADYVFYSSRVFAHAA